jgi:ABC-type uncharacterized transport system involved in gliding motility auxiliary subunit
MKLQDKIIGTTGIVLILFSIVYYSIQNIWGLVNWITLVLGLGGLGYYVFVYYKNREKEISTRNLQYGSNALLQIVIVIAIVGLLAFVTTRQHLRSDWTANKLFSLADQTDKILTGLDKEVKIIAFYRQSMQNGPRDVLDEYAYRSGNLEYEFVDPDENPQLARQYQIKQINTLVVECGKKKETITELSEANLTNAIMKVTREQDKVIYFLTGHGERSISADGPDGYKLATDAIKNENYLVRELNLVQNMVQGKGIPDSCTVLAIISPKSNFFPGELDTIKAYLESGGKGLFLLDPEGPADVAQFLTNFGVNVGNDMVVDVSGMGQLFGAGPGMPMVSSYDQSIAITEGFNIMTFYPLTASVIPMDSKNGYTVKELLKTSTNSYAEKSIAPEVSFDEGVDIPGPITIAALIEKTIGEKKTSLVVFGDSDFAKNGYFKNQGNANLFLNTINYLAEEEDLISIRPKDIEDRRLTLTVADMSTIFYLVVILIPILVIIAGVVVYKKRGK